MVDFAFLDSGTGGIPYLEDLMKKLPEANCIYIADTIHFPYGEKTHEQIVRFVVEICGTIIKKYEPVVIIIACNTMSVNALNVLREAYPLQHFVGTVPAIKLAASITRKKNIGLLATNSTVENPYNIDLKNHFASDCNLFCRGDPELISFIEHESFTSTVEERENACRKAVDFFKNKNCDTIILGCTHFLNLKQEMQKLCGSEITVVDSVDGVTNRALSLFGALRGTDGKRSCPAERVVEKTAVEGEDFETKGETSPSLYITGFCDKKDEKEYDVICKHYNIKFGGKF